MNSKTFCRGATEGGSIIERPDIGGSCSTQRLKGIAGFPLS